MQVDLDAAFVQLQLISCIYTSSCITLMVLGCNERLVSTVDGDNHNIFLLSLLWQVHSRGKALAKDVDFDKIARRTPGFTGADLQNLMNEAAILAARRDLKEISKDEISDALERIIAGPEKKNAVVSEDKKKLVAYHGTK